MPADGGMPERVTYFSGNDRPCEWSPDGQSIHFTSRRDFYYQRMSVFYAIKRVNGGTPEKLLEAYVNNGKMSPDGQWLAYSRGRENWARRHYRGSASTDIWLHNFETGEFRRLTTHDGNDYYPLWSKTSDLVYYVTDQSDDTFNLWQMDLNGDNKTQLTTFTGDGIRFPNISQDGEVIAFEQGTDVWTFNILNNSLNRVEIHAPTDLKKNSIEKMTFTDKATEFIVSPDEKEVAFVVRGDIFVVSLKGKDKTGKTKAITETWARERDISWTPGGDTLLYVSDRSGNQDLYMVHSVDQNSPKLSRALKYKEIQLTASTENEYNPKFSPDGNRIAYISGLGDLHVMNMGGVKDKVLVEGWNIGDYNWSPDGKWIAYSKRDNEYNSDIHIIPSTGGEPVNVTMHPDNDVSPIWSEDGSKLGFVSRRYANTMDAWFVFLSKADHEKTKEEWEYEDEETEYKKNNGKDGEKSKSKVNVKIDLKAMHKRLRRVTSLASTESRLAISPDGKTFAFASNAEGNWNLYTVKWDGTELKQLTKGKTSPAAVSFSNDGKSIFYMSKGKIHKIGVDGDNQKALGFSANMKINHLLERSQKFDEAWGILNERFYDPEFHGVDWKAMKSKYRGLAIEADCIEDFNYVIRLMLGELNASHLGISGPDDTPKTATGMLGVRFDESYDGAGMKVLEVIPNGPCDKEKSRLSPGDIIRAIDGVTVEKSTNIHALLNDKVSEKVILEVQPGSAKKSRTVIVRPVNQGSFDALEYDRWVEEKRALVDKLSSGRLGYVHIRGMGMHNVEIFEMELYAEAHGKDALIIDVRNNGGGSVADYLLAILAPRPHAYTISRDGEKGYPQDRLPLYFWSKPVVAMCNEWSFSNAEIFSHAIKGLDRGKVVGAPTGGLVISTDGTTLIDGARFRIPQRGWYALYSGLNQEKYGCIPDVVVWDKPGDAAKHIDRQLERAVKELLSEL
jgi:tricorn protease